MAFGLAVRSAHALPTLAVAVASDKHHRVRRFRRRHRRGEARGVVGLHVAAVRVGDLLE